MHGKNSYIKKDWNISEKIEKGWEMYTMYGRVQKMWPLIAEDFLQNKEKGELSGEGNDW